VPIPTGSPAPAAAARSLDGSPRDLASLWRRGPALLFFFKCDCPTSPLGARVLPRFAALPGLAVAAVCQDGEEETRAFAEAYAWRGAVEVLIDPEPWPASDAFGVLASPTWFLLGPGGRVEAVAEGWSRAGADALAARAAALAGAAPVAVVQPGDGGPAFRPG